MSPFLLAHFRGLYFTAVLATAEQLGVGLPPDETTQPPPTEINRPADADQPRYRLRDADPERFREAVQRLESFRSKLWPDEEEFDDIRAEIIAALGYTLDADPDDPTTEDDR